MKAPPRLIQEALREDGAFRDLTSRHFIPGDTRLRGQVLCKEAGVLCGLEPAAQAFKAAAPSCRVRFLARDGASLRPGRKVLEVAGTRDILAGERVALNFLQHLSGIATLTRKFVRAVRATRAKIYDTRKTVPGLRALAKHAVRCGGGANHRMGLGSAVLVKDNHWAAWAGNGPIPAHELRRRVRRLKENHPRMEVEMEAKTLGQVRRALGCGADAILLDNMGPALLKEAIRLARRRRPPPIVEVSGGVRLGNVGRLARMGPDRISVGSLTHSAPALDLSFEVKRVER